MVAELRDEDPADNCLEVKHGFDQQVRDEKPIAPAFLPAIANKSDDEPRQCHPKEGDGSHAGQRVRRREVVMNVVGNLRDIVEERDHHEGTQLRCLRTVVYLGQGVGSRHIKILVMTDIDMFAALADPTRRAILEHLGEHPAAVGELAAKVPVSRSAVSQHLKVPKDSGLVGSTPEGSRRVYAVDPRGVTELRDYRDRFWGVALLSYQNRIESPLGASDA